MIQKINSKFSLKKSFRTLQTCLTGIFECRREIFKANEKLYLHQSLAHKVFFCRPPAK